MTISLSFPLQDGDGWPPVSRECLQFSAEGELLRAEVCPLYVQGLSVADIIAVEANADGVVKTWHHVRKSKNSTVWLLRMKDDPMLHNVLRRVLSLGCDVVSASALGSHAINVPEAVDLDEFEEALHFLDGDSTAVAYPSLRHE
jgi:hypothetical protein